MYCSVYFPRCSEIWQHIQHLPSKKSQLYCGGPASWPLTVTKGKRGVQRPCASWGQQPIITQMTQLGTFMLSDLWYLAATCKHNLRDLIWREHTTCWIYLMSRSEGLTFLTLFSCWSICNVLWVKTPSSEQIKYLYCYIWRASTLCT